MCLGFPPVKDNTASRAEDERKQAMESLVVFSAPSEGTGEYRAETEQRLLEIEKIFD